MHYFVTGATGFIGRHLVRALVARGDRVAVLVRSPEKRSVLPDGVEVVEGDMARFAERDIEIPDVEVVVHLAGTVAAESTEEYRRVNYRYLVDFMRYLEARPHHPQRIVFASSLAAAGPTRRGCPKTEDDPMTPIDPYGLAKSDAEVFLQQTTLPVTAVRPPIVFGAEDSATLPLFKMAQHGLGFQVGRHAQELSFVDVRDLVDAIILMSEEEGAGFRQYFASHPETIDSRDLWENLARELERPSTVLRVPQPGLKLLMKAGTWLSRMADFRNPLDEKQYLQLSAEAFTCDSTKLRETLGWTPRYDLAASLRAAVDGYRTLGWL